MTKKELIEQIKDCSDDCEVLLWSWDDKKCEYEQSESLSVFTDLILGASQGFSRAIIVTGNNYSKRTQEQMEELR